MEVSSHLYAKSDLHPGTHCIGGWVGLTTDLDALEKKKILSWRGIEPQSVARRYVSTSVIGWQINWEGLEGRGCGDSTQGGKWSLTSREFSCDRGHQPPAVT